MYKEEAIKFLKLKGHLKPDKDHCIVNLRGTRVSLEELMDEFVEHVYNVSKRELEKDGFKIDVDKVVVLSPKPEPKIPTNLAEAITCLQINWSVADKVEFAKMDEEEAVTAIHHGTGRGIRNEWGLWDKTEPLTQYFNLLGIHHADDMSSIILTSFHRHLNERDIDLKEQIVHIKKFWINNLQ